MTTRFHKLRQLQQHPALARPRKILDRHRYSTPLFILRETLNAFRMHNGFSLSASLSFYAMFALIPMALLMFFLLSHLVISSNYAIVKLAILTSNLVPKFSHRIMIEVYNISKHKAVWGVFGMFALFWAVIPLAGALRSCFYAISSIAETPSFVRRTLKDALAVLGMLLLFFVFTFSGVMLEKVVSFLQPFSPFPGAIDSLTSLFLSTLLIAAFYRVFFPVPVALRHILIGSIVTAALWIAMRPAFSLFLLVNQSYGTIFGGMKNMFISIGWLYYSFAVFLLGTEMISTLRKKEVLLLRGLFGETTETHAGYLEKLMRLFGKTLARGDYVFREGNQGTEMYYLMSGEILIYHHGKMIRKLSAGEYFGEMALLASAERTADAVVESQHARILSISAENFETLLREEPTVAMSLLREMAQRLRQSSFNPELRQ
ncbi:ribonuclease BN/unknown domain fusion protein [mine drainage metagenome]|uniref:Cyclic nucleotide-binding domain-containing protein n=1 Tax=mine drainage metagenome TaxID=410659 RepID=A0A1J5QR66_9ZZZZ